MDAVKISSEFCFGELIASYEMKRKGPKYTVISEKMTFIELNKFKDVLKAKNIPVDGVEKCKKCENFKEAVQFLSTIFKECQNLKGEAFIAEVIFDNKKIKYKLERTEAGLEGTIKSSSFSLKDLINFKNHLIPVCVPVQNIEQTTKITPAIMQEIFEKKTKDGDLSTYKITGGNSTQFTMRDGVAITERVKNLTSVAKGK